MLSDVQRPLGSLLGVLQLSVRIYWRTRQLTLLADCASGQRSSFVATEEPVIAEGLYIVFTKLMKESGLLVATRVVGDMMKVELINDGRVIFVLDSCEGR